MAKKVFISYSHKDAEHLPALIAHLRPLERAGLISPWFDGYIIPGDDIDAKVGEALEQADIVLLLISSDFVNSDYCYTIEMDHALTKHQSGECRVIPVILRDCIWKTAPFGRISGLPTDGKAVMSLHWPDKDEAWRIVAEGVQAAALSGADFAKPAGASSSRGAPVTPQEPAVNPENSHRPFSINRKKTYSDKEKDDFKHFAFEQIARRFEASINALQADLKGSFRMIDANRFTATIYVDGRKQAGVTVWIGGDDFSSDSINWHLNDTGDTSTLNGSLSIESDDGQLSLRERFGFEGGGEDRAMNADVAAEFLWGRFVERISD